MKRIIIFGASNGGKALLRNLSTKEDHTVIAFLDNDASREGTIIEGLEVYSPKKLNRLPFDEIYIGSQFAKEIKQSLLSLGVEEKKIISPPKYMLGDKALPFLDKTIRLQAEKIIIEIADFLQKNSIRYSISYGTLLGIYRDNGIIPWDTDIDIAIFNIPNQDVIEKMRLYLEYFFPDLSPWQGYKILNQKDNSICRGYKIMNKVFHIDLGYTKRQEFCWDDLISQVPSCYFDQLKTFKFNSHPIYTPIDIEGYLQHLYGENWKTPKRDNSFEDNNYSINSSNGFFENHRLTPKRNPSP